MRNYKILNRPMFNRNNSAYGRGIASNLVSEEERQRFNYGGRVGAWNGSSIGSGRGAGSTAGAKFIQQFINDIPWAHIDIAGVTWSKSNSDLFSLGATAFGVRLLNAYVKEFIENKT